MPLDVEKYRHYVAGFNLSPEEQTELIRNVWTVLEGFVDQAYGRHPHQRCRRGLEFHDLQDPLDLLESQASNPFNETQSLNPDPLKH